MRPRALLDLGGVSHQRGEESQHRDEEKNNRQRNEDPMQEQAGFGNPRRVHFRRGLKPGEKRGHEGEQARQKEMDAGAVDFFENLLGGKIGRHAAPVEGQAAEGENDNEGGEGEHFILAGGFRKLRSYKQDGNEDQCQGDDTANQHEERMGQARKGIWHGLVFRQN